MSVRLSTLAPADEAVAQLRGPVSPGGRVGALTYRLGVATWEDVRELALGLPETVEESSADGLLAWRVKNKLFAWERPLRKGDLEALGDAAPKGPILAARVPDVGAKEALLADNPAVYFTTPHFDGWPAILVRLDRIARPELEEVIVEAWLVQAPKRLAKQYLDSAK